MAKNLNKTEVQERMSKLVKQIDDLRYRYHVLNDPTVSDEVYDSLQRELKSLEAEYPELKLADSPLSRIGGRPLDKFVKVRHAVRQWSFDDIFEEAELADWEERILKILEKETGGRPSLEYCCELKIDGLHLVLTYEGGRLKLGATRGDGLVGEDVTQNVKTIQSLPLKLNREADIIVEGEIWLSAEELKKINEKRKQAGEPEFANPRNAAAGTIRQLDSQVVADRHLDCFIYDWSGGREVLPRSQVEELESLKKLGFKVNPYYRLCHNIAEVADYWRTWEKRRGSEPYWLDGVVIKVNQKEYQDRLGYIGKAPRWAVAFKFPAERVTTVVEDIQIQVGRLGTMTPVAHLRPVKLAGTTVKRATLHNEDQIKKLGVKIGDTVVIQKAGDIIPEVVEVLPDLRTGKERNFKMPQNCPICGSPVKKQVSSDKKAAESVAYFCSNKQCLAQEQAAVIHLVSRKAFNIDGLGEKIVEQLMAAGLVKDAADIFTLKVEDLEPLERFAEKSAQNLVEAIAVAKTTTLAKFIYALGIRHVGEETAINLASHFGSLDKLIKASAEELQKAKDIGAVVAKSLRDYFGAAVNLKLVERLLGAGVVIKQPEIKKQRNKEIAGKKFVVTGTLSSLSREEAKERIRQAGGEVAESVSRKTDFVVVGENPGSKAEKARELGVKVLDEKGFLGLL